MAITSMLVMYTLNQSVSSKLPATAYMKLIDVWLLFGLLLPFVIIILLILMEHLPPDNSIAPVKITSAASVKKVLVEGNPEQKTGNHFFLSKNNVVNFARYILPVFEIIFVTLYAVMALVVYYK